MELTPLRQTALWIGGLVSTGLATMLILTTWIKNRQIRAPETRWREACQHEVAETVAREDHRRRARGPEFVLADPDRRVMPGDLRLLQRFGDGLEMRRVLGVFHGEVDRRLPKGTDIILCVDNLGRHLQEVSLELEGTPIVWEREPEIHGTDRREWLRYPYDPTRHGDAMELSVRFTSPDGAPFRERYATRHGFRQLERIRESDASLPSAPAPNTSRRLWWGRATARS